MKKILLCLSALIVSFGLQANNLIISLSSSNTNYTATDDLLIKFELHNDSSSTIKVLKWHTPLETGFNADMFDIYNGKYRLPYKGILVKRLPPKESDYITLTPNAKISGTINLEEGYEFNNTGDYDISYKDYLLKYQIDSATSNKQTQQKTSSSTNNFKFKQSVFNFILSEDRIKKNPIGLFKQTPNYNSCSASEESTASSALDEAELIALIAKNDLNNADLSQLVQNTSTRYKRWFGAYDITRYSTINNNFNNIYNSIASETINFDCSCNASGIDSSSVIAYVYSDRHYNINLCPIFFSSLARTGRDSQSGTLIHELSHFIVVAGTDDLGYGDTNATNLADNDPENAIRNAENHEYFAENSPYVYMPNSTTTITIIPATPTTLNAVVISSRQINLSWQAISNANYYRLYRDNTQVYFSADTNYEDINLTSDTTYFYQLQACANFNTNSCSALSATISTKTLEINDDYGDSIINATTISLNNSSGITASIDTYGDNDYFRIIVPSNGRLTVYSEGNIDTYGYLLNNLGNTLSSNDDRGNAYNFSITRNIIAGTYYIRVRHYDSYGSGNYQLFANFVENGTSGNDDYGNSISTATTITLNTSISGRIDSRGDEDYFRIIIPSAGSLRVYTTGNMDSYGYLIDSANNIIDYDDDSGSFYNFSIEENVGTNTYYIRVRHYSNNRTGNYNLRNKFITNTTQTPASDTFTLTITPSASGTVLSSPADIECDNNNDNCSSAIDANSQISLIVDASSGSVFNNWSGDCTGNDNPYRVIINSDKNCQANFINGTEYNIWDYLVSQNSNNTVIKTDLIISNNYNGNNSSNTYSIISSFDGNSAVEMHVFDDSLDVINYTLDTHTINKYSFSRDSSGRGYIKEPEIINRYASLLDVVYFRQTTLETQYCVISEQLSNYQNYNDVLEITCSDRSVEHGNESVDVYKQYYAKGIGFIAVIDEDYINNGIVNDIISIYTSTRTTSEIIDATSIITGNYDGNWRGNSQPSYNQPTDACRTTYYDIDATINGSVITGTVSTANSANTLNISGNLNINAVSGTLSDNNTVFSGAIYNNKLVGKYENITSGCYGVFLAQVTTAVDTTPNAFSFNPVLVVATSSVVATSARIIISGINTTSTISIIDGEYSVNNASFTSIAGGITNQSIIEVRHSHSANAEQMQSILTVGGVSGIFYSYLDTDNDGIANTTDSDDDNDGMPDFWEDSYDYLNPLDASDANIVRSGSSITNLQEYQNSINSTAAVIFFNYPSLTLGSDGIISFFRFVDFGVSAIDAKDGEIALDLYNIASVNGQTAFIRRGFNDSYLILFSGSYTLIWSVIDSDNNVATKTQIVSVVPQANYSRNRQQQVSVGQSATVYIALNGFAAEYPVTIPISVTGAESVSYTLANSITIPYGIVGSTTLNISGISNTNNNIITIVMGTPTNAIKGMFYEHNIAIISTNVAPIIRRFEITQSGVRGRLISQNGNVTIKSNTYDANGDDLTYTWSSSNLTNINSDGSSNTFIFNPSGLSRGRYTALLSVSDGTLTTTRIARIRVILSDRNMNNDEDGNGIADMNEEPHEDYQIIASSMTFLSSPSNTRISLGEIGSSIGSNSGQITETDIRQHHGSAYRDDTTHAPQDIYDYTVEDLLVNGSSISIIIGLSSPLPANAVLRKYSQNNGWTDFVVNNDNKIESASKLSCNDTDIVWQNGLITGVNCLRLTIKDGGPNDADGLEDGSIDDPVAVSTPANSTNTDSNTSSGGGGCSISLNNTKFDPILYLLLIISGIAIWRRTTKKTNTN